MTICIYCNQKILPGDPLGEERKLFGESTHSPWHTYLWLKARVEAGDKGAEGQMRALQAIVKDDENLPFEVRRHRREL